MVHAVTSSHPSLRRAKDFAFHTVRESGGTAYVMRPDGQCDVYWRTGRKTVRHRRDDRWPRMAHGLSGGVWVMVGSLDTPSVP